MQQNLKFYYTDPAYTTLFTVLPWTVQYMADCRSLWQKLVTHSNSQEQCGLKTRKQKKPQTIKMVASQTRENTSE